VRIVYTPAEGDVQRYDFDPGKVNTMEAEAIEKATGLAWGEFGDKIQKGSAIALRALLWILQRRVHPTLKLADVQFQMDQISAEMDPDELRAAYEATVNDPDMPADKRARQLEYLEAEMAKAGIEPGEVPKAPGSAAVESTPAP